LIPLFRPSCSDLEIKYVNDVLLSGWWGLGPKTEEFEEKFARFTGTRYAIATSSASIALQLALKALDVRGEVIIPALTFVSTGLAALHNGNDVVFADIREDTLNMDWQDVTAQRRTARTGAVIPVWYGGNVNFMPAWKASNIKFIEDCAHAAGSKSAGRQGHAACWSFHAVKNLATGDGGMITTSDAETASKLRRLRWCGINRSTWDRDQGKYGWDYDVAEAGHKGHMNDITAALGLAQLERLDELNLARRNVVSKYLDLMQGLDWLQVPSLTGNRLDFEYRSWHLFVVRVPAPVRDRFIDHMLANGVSAGVHYKPLNEYPIFGPKQPLPVTDRVWRTLVTLPLYPDLTESDTDKVIAAVRSFNPAIT
jgi:perosamine synthetase